MISVLRKAKNHMLLCIDHAGQKVNLVGVEREGNRLNVVMFSKLPLADLSKFLREETRELPGKIEEVRVSGSLEMTFHKVFKLPVMKKGLIESAARAKVLKAYGNEHQHKYVDLGETEDTSGKVTRMVLAAGMKRDYLEQMQDAFSGFRVKPSVYTTYPMAVRVLLERCGVTFEEPLAFVDLQTPVSRIVIFKGGDIQLTREVHTAEKDEGGDGSQLVMDIYRTLLYYSDTYPSERVGKLVVAGDAGTPEIRLSLKEKSGIEITPLDLGEVSLGVSDQRPASPACLGLALLRPESLDFDFVPLSVQEKGRFKKTMVLSGSACVLLFLALLAVISRLSFELGDLNAYQAGVKGEIRLREDRLKELALEFVSQSLEDSQPQWSEIMLELSAVVPDGVLLKSLVLRRLKNGWQAQIEGVASGDDELRSLLVLEETQQRFSRSPVFTNLRLVEKEIVGSGVQFKILCQLKT